MLRNTLILRRQSDYVLRNTLILLTNDFILFVMLFLYIT